jgi:ABC-type branched-subunit amino acid transport system substrate-binding protein
MLSLYRSSHRRLLAAGLVTVVLAAGCGRSSGETETGAASDSSTSTTAAAAAEQAGSFGDLGQVCGPGDAKGATARGVTDTEIAITTLGDPSNTVKPGLGQQFFDMGDAFVKWCNDAGGINGRQIVLHKRDAKLFEAAARVIEACQTDFMLVGGGTPLDDATVKPRLDCNMGNIPAYVTSVTAIKAPLQARPQPTPVDQVMTGPFFRIADYIPGAGKGVAIEMHNGPGGPATGNRYKDSVELGGLKVTNLTLNPSTGVDNWRPYLEQMRSSGATMIGGVAIPDYASFVSTMHDIGWEPDALIALGAGYEGATAEAAKSTPFPKNSWAMANTYPFELAKDNPATQTLLDLLHGVAPDAKPAAFHVRSLSGFLLWATSVKACGSDVTVKCVIDHAVAQKAWTGGGLHPANGVGPDAEMSPCFALMKITTKGFVYDKEATAPTDGVFNCDPKNVPKLTKNYDDVK